MLLELFKIIAHYLTFGTGVLHLIQINHQPDATVFQFIILTFVYSSTSAQRQDNKLKNCCIKLVIYLNCTMMHGLTNLKFYI